MEGETEQNEQKEQKEENQQNEQIENNEEKEENEKNEQNKQNGNKDENEQKVEYEILSDDVSNVDFSFKIIVIGDSAVGKSSLTLKGTKDHFKDFYTPTIGFEFLSFNIKINDQIVKLQIWDTCGQEVYRSLISSFYRNSSLAIIVYAIDNQESFDNLESWLDEIKSQTHPNLKIFLVGNKSDLSDQRAVSKESAEELAKEHNLDFFIETSAKLGTNSREVFIKAAQILLEDYKNYKDKEGKDPNMSTEKSSISLTSQENDEDDKNKENEEENMRRKKCCL